MNNRPRRLRDIFNPPPNADRPPPPCDSMDLIDEVATSEEIDVEGIAGRFRQSEQQLWHAVEEELKDGRNG
ncbi:MAG: hypothetical protein HY716_09155 [Planctomycetes bacterium]|nr:hypothetical protein [Planctomycetota bacterium]